MRDWRQTEADKFSRWLSTNCEPCPVVECGAMVCGDEQKITHEEWHTSINDDRAALRDRQEDIEGTFLVTRDQINAALASFDTDRDALRNRLALLEEQFTSANLQLENLMVTVTQLDGRVAALEGGP